VWRGSQARTVCGAHGDQVPRRRAAGLPSSGHRRSSMAGKAGDAGWSRGDGSRRGRGSTTANARSPQRSPAQPAPAREAAHILGAVTRATSSLRRWRRSSPAAANEERGEVGFVRSLVLLCHPVGSSLPPLSGPAAAGRARGCGRRAGRRRRRGSLPPRRRRQGGRGGALLPFRVGA
jgi:hypothetical protein